MVYALYLQRFRLRGVGRVSEDTYAGVGEHIKLQVEG